MKKKALEYWRRRELDNYRANAAKESNYDKEIERIYARMYLQAQKEIDAFYGRYAGTEGITIAEAKKRVSQLDIKRYEAKAKEYVANKDLSKQANEEMRLYNLTMKVNRLEMLKAEMGLDLVKGFDELEKLTGQKLNQRAIEEFTRQAGILGESVYEPGEKAKSIVGASYKNATFSERIWMYQDALKSELGKLLQSGMVQGRNPRELAGQLRKSMDASRYASERLMRTELARVQLEAQKQSLTKNGYDEFVFISLESGCEDCKAMDGKHFKVKDMLVGENAPPIHPHCRCSIAAYMDEEEFYKWLDEIDPAGALSIGG
jgi:SPP1 gp7 family putative phage head morphogenesis protein